MPVGTVVRGRRRRRPGRPGLAGDRWLAAPGRARGARQRPLPDQPPPGPGLRRTGREGRGALVRLELKLLADVALVGLPNAGQEHADLAHLGGAAQGRRLSLHHARAAPRRGAGGARPATRPSSWWPTSPDWWRGRPTGRGLGHRFLRHVERARALVVLLDLAAGRRHAGGGAGADPARRVAAATGPNCSSVLGWWWAPRPTWSPPRSAATPAATPSFSISAVTGHGDRRAARPAGRAWWSRPGPPRPSPTVRRVHRPLPEGVESCAGRRRVLRRRSAGSPCGPWPCRDLNDDRRRGLRPGAPAPPRGRAGPGAGRGPRRRRRAPGQAHLHLPARRRGLDAAPVAETACRPRQRRPAVGGRTAARGRDRRPTLDRRVDRRPRRRPGAHRGGQDRVVVDHERRRRAWTTPPSSGCAPRSPSCAGSATASCS